MPTTLILGYTKFRNEVLITLRYNHDPKDILLTPIAHTCLGRCFALEVSNKMPTTVPVGVLGVIVKNVIRHKMWYKIFGNL